MFRFCKTNIYSLYNVDFVCMSEVPIVLISRSSIAKAFIESVQFGKLRIRTPNIFTCTPRFVPTCVQLVLKGSRDYNPTADELRVI
jgi:hypothetical protein